NRYFEWTASRHRGHLVRPGGSDLAADHVFVRDHPAGHRNLQYRHQMAALLQMPFQRDRIVPWVKGTGRRWNRRHSDQSEILGRVMLSCKIHLWPTSGPWMPPIRKTEKPAWSAQIWTADGCCFAPDG